jgi:membrane associated rhomboid family serine protease
MSLEYKNEEPPAETFEEQEVGQPVEPVITYYSYLLIACLIAVFLTQISVDGLETIVTGGDLSVSLAGFDKMNFRLGQYWRILTGAAVHAGILHLFFNSYALYVLGRLTEILSNRAHLAVVFLLSVIGGGILSLLFIPDAISVGASGGIVGLLGYMTVYGFKRRKLLPEGFLKNMLFNIGFIAFIGLFLMEKIDNFGHLGGLLTGLVYGLIQIPGDLYQDPREVRPVTEGMGMIALGLFVFTSIFAILVILQFIKF